MNRESKRRKKTSSSHREKRNVDENTQLLKELIENLKSHRKDVHSASSKTTHGDCKKVLRKMKSILPVIVDTFIVKSTTTNNYISLVLDIFRMLISNEVCDYGVSTFDHGEDKSFLEYIFYFLRLGIEIKDKNIVFKSLHVLELMFDLLYVEFLTDRYVAVLRDLVNFLSDTYVVLEALRTTSISSSTTIVISIFQHSKELYKLDKTFDVKFDSSDAASRCISVLETLLSRNLRNGGAQFCQMRSIETPLWNSVRYAIKNNRIIHSSTIDFVQTLIDYCHALEPLPRAKIFSRMLMSSMF